MPCNSSYMDPTNLEKDLSTVYGLLDELKTGKLPENFGDGFDSRVYNQHLTVTDLHFKVKSLCKKLQKTDVTKFSLEMQMWWRDHQAADKKRVAQELEEIKEAKAKAEAIAKLTPYERKLLGLK